MKALTGYMFSFLLWSLIPTSAPFITCLAYLISLGKWEMSSARWLNNCCLRRSGPLNSIYAFIHSLGGHSKPYSLQFDLLICSLQSGVSIFWKPQKLCIRPSFEYFLEISIVRLLNKNWIQFFLEGKFHNICIFEDAFVIRKDCAGQMHRRVQSAEIKIRVAIQGTKLCVLKCSHILHPPWWPHQCREMSREENIHWNKLLFICLWYNEKDTPIGTSSKVLISAMTHQLVQGHPY